MKNFVPFYFEGNLYFGWIKSKRDFNKVIKAYKGQMTKDQLLDRSHGHCNNEFYGDNKQFGLYSEYTDKQILREFLTENNIEL